MPYRFTCPHCAAETLVDDKYSGTRGPCVQCGRIVIIPAFAEGAAEPPREAARGAAPRSARPWVPRLVAVAGVLAVIVGMLGYVVVTRVRPAVARLRTSAARGACLSNLQSIALALNEYAEDYGTYPPPVVTDDDNGRPLHSWRVLILPYLGYDNLYQQYDLTRPWDSEENISVMGRMPTEFTCPAATVYGFGTANYVLVTGPGTLFPPSGPLAPGDVTDGLAQTLLVVEIDTSQGAGAQWNEPRDLDIRRMQMNVDGARGGEIGSEHPGGANVATCDGRVHFLRASQPAGTVRALVSPSGGEALPDDVLD